MLDRNASKTIKLKEYNQYGERDNQYDSDDTEEEIGKILGETLPDDTQQTEFARVTLVIYEIENKVKDKNRRIAELEEKVQLKKDYGAEITPGGEAAFQECCDFFIEKAQKTDDTGLGDEEAEEIEQFISKYENAPQITQVLWQLYYLQLERESEMVNLEELQDQLLNV